MFLSCYTRTWCPVFLFRDGGLFFGLRTRRKVELDLPFLVQDEARAKRFAGTGPEPGDDLFGAALLEQLTGEALEWEALNERRSAHELTLLEAEELRPGIADYLAAAERYDLKRAIVSSSSRRWIDHQLARLERAIGWEAIVTADHNEERAKPRPTLYLEALDALGVEADEAVAFEDSPNGIRAAKAAGIFVVGIPNSVTQDLALDEADLVVDSLAELPPDELLARFS